MATNADIVEQLTTIRDWLRYAVTQFESNDIYYGHGTDEPWDEAVHLVLGCLNLPLDIDERVLDAKLTIDERCKLVDLINQRVTDRVPVPYLTHAAFQNGVRFFVDKRVVIPRSPIAELIDDEFSPWIEPERVSRILELCTGSGVLACLSALNFTDAEVVATDISQDALDVAKKNIDDFGLDDQIELIKGDLFEGVSQDEKFDVIIANPPYVSQEELAVSPPEFAHEPRSGLEADDEGLAIVLKILKNAKDYLSPTGILIVETGNSEDALIERFPDVPFTWLEMERGGSGVFLLTAEQVREFSAEFSAQAA